MTVETDWWIPYLVPSGTVLAAVVALFAARRAWKGIQAQITANRENLTTQLDHQEDLHKKSLEADRQRQLRSERLDALVSAAKTLEETQWALMGLVTARLSGNEARLKECDDQVHRAFDNSRIADMRLRLLGLSTSAAKFSEAWSALSITYGNIRDHPSPEDLVTVTNHLSTIREVIDVFKNALD